MTASNCPIFVVGAPRSGTTMLRYMLCSHPRIYIPPESNFIPGLFRHRRDKVMSTSEAARILNKILKYRVFFRDWQGAPIDPLAAAESLSGGTPASLLDFLYGSYAAQFGAQRWGDKTPIYTTHMDLIAEIFPSAQFIHIIRDGRDVARSMIEAYTARNFFYVDVYYAALSWKRRVTQAMKSGNRLGPGRYFQLRYEDLSRKPERHLRELCAFLGEEYEPAMTEPHKTARQHYHSKGIHSRTRQPVSDDRVGRWQKEMSKADLLVFQTVAGDVLQRCGYEQFDTGNGSFAEQARLYRLHSKHALIEGLRRAISIAGVFHPTSLLSRMRH